MIYNLAIYHHGYTGIHGQEVVISNKKHLTIVKLDDYYYLLCCITDLHIVSFRVSQNCLEPTDGVSAFILPYFPRISTFPGPLLPPDSHLSYYAIILRPALAVVFSTFYHNIMGPELQPLT